jgi:hypothetical protein
MKVASFIILRYSCMGLPSDRLLSVPTEPFTMRHAALLCLLLGSFLLQAQPGELPEKPLETGNLAQQFEYVIEKSGRYQEYKVIKRVWIDALEDNVADSVQAYRGAIKADAGRIAERDTRITTLEKQLADTQATLDKTESEKNSMSFLGIAWSKGGYSTFVWSLVALFALLAGFLYTRSRAVSVESARTQKSHGDLQAEYDAYKKRALEREQKLKRELQDELNRRSGSST